MHGNQAGHWELRMDIRNVSDFRKAVRMARAQSARGFEAFYVMSDGELVPFTNDKQRVFGMLEAIANGTEYDEWRPVGMTL